jgi:MFS family permease
MLQLLRRNPELRWLFLAQVVSYMGDWFTFVALAGMVKDATGSAFLVSLAYVAFSLPSFLASPFAGSVVDRFDRRRLLIVISGLQTIAALGLLTGSVHRVWPLFVFQGTISAMAAFVRPAIDAGVPNLAASPEELRQANALFGSTWGVMLAAGAAIGGVFSQAFGRPAAFVADAVSFALALALFMLIKRPMQEAQHGHRAAGHPFRDMREAVQYARRDNAVLALILSKASFAIGAGMVSQLPVLASSVYHWKDGGTGMLLGARGLGAGLGPIIAARFTRGKVSRVLQVCGIAGLSCSFFYLFAGVAPVIYLAALFIALAHLGGGSQWTLSTYGLQLRTPDHIRGRVLAGDFAIVTLVMTFSGLGAGALSSATSVRPTIITFSVVGAIAGFAYLRYTKPIIARLRDEEAALPH